jgi:hypothetical protein
VLIKKTEFDGTVKLEELYVVIALLRDLKTETEPAFEKSNTLLIQITGNVGRKVYHEGAKPLRKPLEYCYAFDLRVCSLKKKLRNEQ